MGAFERQVIDPNWTYALRCRRTAAVWQKKARGQDFAFCAKKLQSYLAAHDLGKKRRYGIAELADLLRAIAREFPAIRKALEPTHLLGRQLAVFPVERS